MADSEPLVLTDKNVFPSEEIIFGIIGDKRTIWQNVMTYVKDNYKDATGEWRFYNDGKQWLFKMQLKKKTLFWIGVLRDTFRITFYFGNKAEPVILASTLPVAYKDGFIAAVRYGNIRAITVKVTGTDDLDNIYKLIDLKAKIK